MQRVNPIAGKPLEQTILDHASGAAEALLRRLEDEMNGSVQVRIGGEAPGRANQHGDVPVVPAAVKRTRGLACVRYAGVLIDRQCVHIGAEANAAARRTTPKAAHDARAADAAMDVKPKSSKGFRNKASGAMFEEAEFRVPVNIPPQPDQPAELAGVQSRSDSWAAQGSTPVL
jgi:hypothetical protein